MADDRVALEGLYVELDARFLVISQIVLEILRLRGFKSQYIVCLG